MDASSTLLKARSAVRDAQSQPPSHDSVLRGWLRNNIVHQNDWDALPRADRERLAHLSNTDDVLDGLLHHGLVTSYVATRLKSGKPFGLVLGHYRVLDRLGSGGMGVVFKAEHVRLRQLSAVKVLPVYATSDRASRHVQRFNAEVKALAQLRHANIVRAVDAGELVSTDPEDPVLHYFVMDYVEGRDLDDKVRADGPLNVSEACDYAAQIADALAEAHTHQLVHRDIKPSNVIVTLDQRAMLLDFGLVRQFRHRMTEPGVALGTLDYIAPEQAYDAGSVDIRADLYSLGTTLFWCLTGQPPFASKGDVTEEFLRRRTMPPPSSRHWRPDVPAELDAVIQRLMAPNPDDRYASPQAVVSVLMPFVRAKVRETLLIPINTVQLDATPASRRSSTSDSAIRLHQHRILVVDDEEPVRSFCRRALQMEGLPCDEAGSGEEASLALREAPYDLVLLDVVLPGTSGFKICEQLRHEPPAANLKVILTSGQASGDDLAHALEVGADDYLAKPFSVLQLLGRVKSALRLKDAQDRSDLLTRNLLSINHQLEQTLTTRDSDLVHARNALVLALAELVTQRDLEATSGHLVRMRRYCRVLAEEAAGTQAFSAQIDPNFVAMLECCAPLKDIGKVGLPDHILLKPGRLEPDERIIMQSHTVLGAETLKKVAKRHGSGVAFLRMAVDVARHHHERFDGKGYPDRLGGNNIPLAARIVSIADVYDALRSRRAYRPSLEHPAALEFMTEASPGQYDPSLIQAFLRAGDEFNRIFEDVPD